MKTAMKRYRQYTITNPTDANDIENGRCPLYAVTWSLEENEQYWPKGHDYYIGNGENIVKDNIFLRKRLSEEVLHKCVTKA